MNANRFLWSVNFAIFASFFLLVEFGQSIGNYFENSQFYLAYMFLPALGLILVWMVLQKWISTKALLVISMLVESILILVLGYLSLKFNQTNADSLMYLIGYEMIYHRYIFGAILATSFSSLYLASVNRIEASRIVRVLPSIESWKQIFVDALISVGILLSILIVAVRFNFGPSLMLSGLFVGIGCFILLFNPNSEESPTNEKEQKKNVNAENKSLQVQKDHFSFIVWGSLFLSFALMFMWPMEMIRFVDGNTMWFLNTPSIFLEEIIIGLELVGVILLIGLLIMPKIQHKLGKISLESFLLIGTIAAIGAQYLYLNLGISFFRIGITRVLTPIIFVSFFWWIFSLLQKREGSSVNALGSLFILGGFGGWASMLLTSDPDGSISSPIVLILLITFSVFCILHKLLRKMSTQKKEEKKNIPSRFDNLVLKLSQSSSALKSVLFILIVLIPVNITFVSANSEENFQILANLNNNAIVYLADPTTRVDQNYLPNFGLSDYHEIDPNIQISAAKNEWESVQLVLRPINQNHWELRSLSFSGFTSLTSETSIPANESNFRAFEVKYIEGLNNIVADRLESLSSIVMNDGKNHPVWLDFHVPTDTPAGEYSGIITIAVENISDPNEGMYPTCNIEFTVNLKVYDFRLPEIPTLKSNFGFSTGNDEFARVIGMYDDYRMMHWSFVHFPSIILNADGTVNSLNYTEFDEHMDEIYGYGTYTIGIHQHPIYALPDGIFVVNGQDYTRENYSSSPQYNTTFTQFFTEFEAYTKTKTYLDDFNVSHSWYGDLYFNGDDEIDARGEEIIASSLAKYQWLKSMNMTLPIMQTTGYNERILNEVDIWCQHGVGEHRDTFIEWQAEGHDMWLYTTRGPRYPNPSSSTSGFAIQTRAIAWQCFVFNYTNYLIWDIATPYNGGYGYGYQGWNGGTIMYEVNGQLMPSTRMELTREGFEDYEYFNLLFKSLEKMEQDGLSNSTAYHEGTLLIERIQSLFPFGYNTIMDYTEFNELRIDLGEFLDQHSILK